jgi:hypothetical protein
MQARAMRYLKLDRTRAADTEGPLERCRYADDQPLVRGRYFITRPKQKAKLMAHTPL